MRLADWLVPLLVAAAACGRPAGDEAKPDLCNESVNHVMALVAGVGAEPDGRERLVMGVATGASVVKCRVEGLTRAQADCILAVKTPDELLGLGSCAAIRAREPSWLILPPSPEEMAGLEERLRAPDGPRTGPVRYRQLAGSGSGTCGLRDDGSLQCWGLPVRVPTGSLTSIGWRWHLCGLDGAGALVCTSDTRGDDLSYLPGEPLIDFAEGPSHGCGIRKRDGGIVCWTRKGWSDAAPGPVTPPTGAFEEIVSGAGYSCARSRNGRATCFGPEATPAPADRLGSLAGGLWSVCGIREDRTLTCWGRNVHGEADPPPGTYRTVRADGTVCWGMNHLGQANVPQEASDQRWHRPGR